ERKKIADAINVVRSYLRGSDVEIFQLVQKALPWIRSTERPAPDELTDDQKKFWHSTRILAVSDLHDGLEQIERQLRSPQKPKRKGQNSYKWSARNVVLAARLQGIIRIATGADYHYQKGGDLPPWYEIKDHPKINRGKPGWPAVFEFVKLALPNSPAQDL